MIVRDQRLFGAASRCISRGTSAVSRPSQRRHAHAVPRLQDEESIVKNGVGNLFSPAAFQVAWYQEMNYLVSKLNALTMSTGEENKNVKELLLEHSRDPANAALFNYASMTHNIHFFFEALNSHKEPIAAPTALVTEIEKDFASLDDLRTSLLDTADAMFGPGFVWLVRARVSSPETHLGARMRFRILPTYHAGSPYAGAHFRQQSYDTNNHDPTTFREAVERGLSSLEMFRQTTFQNSVGAFGPMSRQAREQKLSRGGVEVEPLLCVNTWEHAWIRDWGIYTPDNEGRLQAGKRRYLETFWDTINWDVVWRRCEASLTSENSRRGSGAGSNAFIM